jgi:ribosome maturation factor RimP
LDLLTNDIERLITPTAEALGFLLVRVIVSGKNQKKVQIMAEKADGSGMTLDACAALSRAISAVLEAEDPIDGAYTLEVSSPGIDRPLVRLRDFERFAGFEARVELKTPVDGRARFTGKLLGVDGETIRLRAEGDIDVTFTENDVRRAKLMMTDDLIAAAAAKKS